MDEPAQDDITHQLRQAINQDGRSLYEIAKASKVDRPNLARFMKGERKLTFETAAAVCQVLGLRLVKVEAQGSSQELPSPATEPTEKGSVAEQQAEAPPPRRRRKQGK